MKLEPSLPRILKMDALLLLRQPVISLVFLMLRVPNKRVLEVLILEAALLNTVPQRVQLIQIVHHLNVHLLVGLREFPLLDLLRNSDFSQRLQNMFQLVLRFHRFFFPVDILHQERVLSDGKLGDCEFFLIEFLLFQHGSRDAPFVQEQEDVVANAT